MAFLSLEAGMISRFLLHHVRGRYLNEVELARRYRLLARACKFREVDVR